MEAIYTENSSDLEDLREEYKNELTMLHASLKKLNRDLDFSAIFNPLLAETGPAMAHVPRLAKQIARMKRYIDEEKALRQSYRWSIGVFSSPSVDPEGRCSANKKIHERGIVGREEFVPVSLVVLQFRPDGSPLCVQP